MALPASLLAAVEAHPCFTGCYSHEIPVTICVDLVRSPVTSFHAACQDCRMFHVGALASLLPHGTTQYTLAQELAAHMRAVRGYRWSFSGYHATGPGFWLSAAYYGDGLFLIDGSRNHGSVSAPGKDVDLLVQAFKSRLAHPVDPGMLDPTLYAADVVYLSCAPSLGPIKTKKDIELHHQCSRTPRQGSRRVTIVEFLPLTMAVVSPIVLTVLPRSVPGRAAPQWTSSDVGAICKHCNKRVQALTILNDMQFNCMC